MVNWWLILIAVILALALLGLSIYIVLLYISEEDAEGGYLAKVIVVFGFTLASVTVLLLPFDVANRTDPTSIPKWSQQIDTETMWEIILWMTLVMAIIVVPFTTFYYEAYDPDNEKPFNQLLPALGYTAIFAIIIIGLTLILWYTVGYADITYWNYKVPIQYILNYDTSAILFVQETSKETLELKVSFFVYFVAVAVFAGWIMFFIYGGIGLVALPIDNISDFINRPKPISAAEFASEKVEVAKKAQLLLQSAETLLKEKARGNMSRSTKRQINILRSETMVLEEHLERVIFAAKNGSPFVALGQILVGIIGGIISAIWVIHIFIYNAADIDPFLNTMLTTLDDAFALLGVLAYAIFSFYLLWCTFKGQVKFGMRLVFFKIHPMKVGDTMLNALLFNCAMIMICSLAVVQFCSESFDVYVSNTAIGALLNVYVGKLRGIGEAISYMKFFFVGVAFLSIFWVIFCPRKKPKKNIYESLNKNK
eukprot:GILI01011460.1.p1 GENE.GILI01011460.1~~GILI01011460.1.p1  ORF type:complete len:481 (-),score=98.75 GILI01011460.1:226-1668(-)